LAFDDLAHGGDGEEWRCENEEFITKLVPKCFQNVDIPSI
jgi:hypothetical protein